MPNVFSPDQLRLFLLLAGLTYLLTAPSGSSNPANRAGADRAGANPALSNAVGTLPSSSLSLAAQPIARDGCPSDRRLVQLPSDAVLNLRQSPNGTIVTTLAPGSAVTLQQMDPTGQWSWVSLDNGSQGWVFNPYLSCG